MTVRLLDLPFGVTEGGFVYVIAYSNNTIKVGKTQTPQTRIATHVCTAVKFDVTVTDVWVSAAHPNYSDTERTLIAMAGTLAGVSDPLTRRKETFAGVDFDVLVGICRQLGLEEAPSLPVAEPRLGRKRPSGNVVRMRPRKPSAPRAARSTPHPSALAELVSSARVRAGITQDELAERSGVSRSSISRWERGQAERPDPAQLRAVCQVIGVSAQDAAASLGFFDAPAVSA